MTVELKWGQISRYSEKFFSELTTWTCSTEHPLGMPVPRSPDRPKEGLNGGHRFPRCCSKLKALTPTRAYRIEMNGRERRILEKQLGKVTTGSEGR